MEHVKALQVNMPFVDTMLQTPKYFNLLKGLFAARKDLAEVAEKLMSELPEKKGDPGNIVIPCQFGNDVSTRALADSGASINLMPYSFFKKLNLPAPKPTTLTLRVGDESVMFKANPEIKQEEEKREEISFIQLDDEVLQKELDILLKEDPITVSGSLEEQSAEKVKGMEVQHANVACLDMMPFGKESSTKENEAINGSGAEADHQFTTKPKARTIMKYEVIKFKEKDKSCSEEDNLQLVAKGSFHG
ncbi:uncharacterized protein LOC111907067 [Lactuca sativa]|uniref:uncharacterized protein LOC111907067 n=1 Tax=Lactuca sativa TaxID=4236 RepID=UPI0022B071CE|nr:uncharacterized protein LOC111907067 [Lactuca sativa]